MEGVGWWREAVKQVMLGWVRSTWSTRVEQDELVGVVWYVRVRSMLFRVDESLS